MGATAVADRTEWSEVVDGTAIGETRRVQVDGSEQDIEVTPLWSDEEGVTADVQVPDDPLNINTLGRLVNTLNLIVMLGPPM